MKDATVTRRSSGPGPTGPDGEQRVRVLHLVTTLDVGGLERVVLDLARRADGSRFDLRVACLDRAGALGKEFEAIGVRPESLELMDVGIFGKVRRFADFLRRARPHVLHTHNSGPHLVGALAARFGGAPVLVHTKHGRNYVDRRKAVLASRLASRLTARVVAVSHDAAQVAREIEKAPSRLVSVIHNGIDVSRFATRDAHEAPPDGAARAVHVARLNRVKDQTTLLRAARIAADQEPRFSLDIVGDGPAKSDLERLRAELRLEPHVRMLGMRDDVPQLLHQAHYFVLSSISEGISLTLLEAMASGLAIVATDVGGNREVVDHERTGLLAPARDPEALAAAMLRVTRDPALARKWGAAGRTRVEKDFNLTNTVNAYERLYLELLGKRRRLEGLGATAPGDALRTAGC